ncbi:hypothetical protein IWW36_003072 [Coemansia brasiliensis]|uniref:Uncharacterized protein n=1 Tax=Coemansia brasiliensis TaxID=2650707 RepID=A0A9W8I8G6_9FUNG|nr:hypothetical protein IWW36_003072 [Coemansia brasiliensis]
MDVFDGKKIERQELFGNNGDASTKEPAADSQDIEMFDELMKSRLDIEDNNSTAAKESASSTDEKEDIPVFRMFASAKAVKVETAPVEPVFIAPERPQASMEESDSEDHWNMLKSAAIDAQTIKNMANIPLPALQFPKRVIHIKVEPKESTLGNSESSTTDKQRNRRKRRRPIKRTEQPYVRMLSPYMGGVVKGEMLADVLRKEEIKRVREAKLAAKRGGRGGFRGRGRGRIFK